MGCCEMGSGWCGLLYLVNGLVEFSLETHGVGVFSYVDGYNLFFSFY